MHQSRQQISKAFNASKTLAEATQREVLLLGKDRDETIKFLHEQRSEDRAAQAVAKEQLHQANLKSVKFSSEVDHLRSQSVQFKETIDSQKEALATLRQCPREDPQVQVRIGELNAKILQGEAQLQAAHSRIEEMRKVHENSQKACHQLESDLSGLQLHLDEAKEQVERNASAHGQELEKIKAARKDELASVSQASKAHLAEVRRSWENRDKHTKHEFEMMKVRIQELEQETHNLATSTGSEEDLVS